MKSGKFDEEIHAFILGSGSAIPDPVRGNPSSAVMIDGDILLFDCGERTTVNLIQAGINPIDIDSVFFTHLHWDHIADFNYFLITTWNCGRSDPYNIYGPPGTEEMIDNMIEAHSIDREYIEAKSRKEIDSTIKYDLEGLKEGIVAETDEYTVTAKEVEHLNLVGDDGDFEHSSWAFRVDSSYGSVAISGDTQMCQAMVDLSKDVDVLIHEATFLDEKEGALVPHSTPRDAGKVAQQAGAEKLVLTHLGTYGSYPETVQMAAPYYDPERGPETWSAIIREAADEFDGPIVLAEDSMHVDI